MRGGMAFIQNLSIGETVLVAIVAILVFGNRLPEVAARVFRHVGALRRQLDDLRRETGIDRELRDMQDAFRGTADIVNREVRDARIEPPRDIESYRKREEPTDVSAPDASEPEPESEPSGGETAEDTGTRDSA